MAPTCSKATYAMNSQCNGMRPEYGSLEPAAVFGENGGVLARIVAFVLPLGLDTLAIAITQK